MQDYRYFILCRDRAESRRMRRFVAEQEAGFNLQAGTWPELIQAALDAYLLSLPASDWQAALASAMEQLSDAFWSRSFELAPGETKTAVAVELDRLLRASAPDQQLTAVSGDSLSARAMRHLADLTRLHQAMGCMLPADLQAVKAVLNADGSPTLRLLRVVTANTQLKADPWQSALIEKLNHDSCSAGCGLVESLLQQFQSVPAAEGKSALGFLQHHLYAGNTEPRDADVSLQWLAARDYLEEVEVVAGMIQHALKVNPALRTSEIALLLPDDPAYAVAVQEVFTHAGLPTSGLHCRQQQRDLAGELVFHLLQSLRKPAPTMALASFVTSPLLPWSRAEGFSIAAALMNGDYTLKKVELAYRSQNEILDAVRNGAETSADLRAVLTALPHWLEHTAGYEVQKTQVGTITESLLPLVKEGGNIPWDLLIAEAAPKPLSNETAGELTREGIAVFSENEEPWRSVHSLFVLGFNNGHYPRETQVSPVFSAADLGALKRLGYQLQTPDDRNADARALFVRQLRVASGQIHFLLARRDANGKELAPSASLSFMAQLFGKGSSPEDLILELDTSAGRDNAHGLALASAENAAPARAIEIGDLQLKSNLLEINKNDDGSFRPQSPSSLETLMTSPLAWLLNRTGLEPKEWLPDRLDIMAKGTLAHAVFEKLFAPGKPLPGADEVKAQVPALLLQIIVAQMPFLNRPEWRVERYHLEKEILQAALRWQEVLSSLGARVMGVEVWLKGFLDKQPIHGSADLLLELPEGKILVVDYKKSSSKKRKERMTKGFDSQASLYRLMLQTGSASFKIEDGGTVDFDEEREIGVLYYLMNDQVSLTDTDRLISPGLSDVEELGADVAAMALPRIRDRLAQVARGEVRLNRESDEKWFEKNAGIKLYALDSSPLIRMFMLPEEEGE